MAFKFCLGWVCWRWKKVWWARLICSITSSTLVPPHVEEFLWVVVCAHVWHGYGMNLPCFIFYYFSLSVAPGGSGLFCLTFLVQLTVENITYHPCCWSYQHILLEWLICHKNRFKCCFWKILKLLIDVKRHNKCIMFTCNKFLAIQRH
jgi:hypothetical protein